MINNSILYIKELDEFCTKYLKHTNPIDNLKYIQDHSHLRSQVSELFLLYDKLSFRVYGENVPLMMLIEWFGAENLLKLLKDNALEFVLRDKIFAYNVKDIEHIIPLQSGTLDTDCHKNPKTSAKMGFEWLHEDKMPSSKIRKQIINKTRKKTKKLPKQHDINDIYNFYCETYNVPKDKLFSLEEKKQLVGVADNSLEISLAAENNYNFWNSDMKWKILNKATKKYSEANLIQIKTKKIMKINSLPNISKLIRQGHIPTEDIVKIRNQKNTQKFRKWIRTTSDKTDCETVSKEYVESLREKYDFAGKKWFKYGKLGVICAVSGLVGSYVGDSVGGYLGTGLGIGIDYTINSIDSSIIDNYLKGWSPENFIYDTIKPYSTQNKNNKMN